MDLALDIKQKQRNIQLILAGLVLSSISIGLSETILPLYAEYVNVPLVSMGFIFALSPLVSSFIQFSMSSLSDRFGRKVLLIVNRITSAITLGITPLARTTASLSMLRIVGSFSNPGGPLVSPLIYENSEGSHRVKLLSVERSIITLVMAGSMVFSGFLLMNFGFSWVFIIGALTQIISFLLVFRLKEAFKRIEVKGFKENMSNIFSLRGLDRDVYLISFS